MRYDFNPIAILGHLWMWALVAGVFFRNMIGFVFLCFDWDIEKEIEEFSDKEAWVRSNQRAKANALHEWENIKAMPIVALRLVLGTILCFGLVMLDLVYDITTVIFPKAKFKPVPQLEPDIFNRAMPGGWRQI